jgi:antitoxin MazE
MKVKLVRIGNSRGIRIPKPLIEECGFGEAVEVRVERRRLIVEATHPPREGWDKAFQAAGSASRDELLLDAIPASDFDGKEWRW